MDNIERLTEELNAKEERERLAALRKIKKLCDEGKIERPIPNGNVNNHIHTLYSFSPYSPTKAAYMAWKSGLITAGIMDHDSIAGAEEFIEACAILGISSTVGFECRVSVRNTPFNGRRINNPDQNSVMYVAMHGVPHQHIEKAQNWLSHYRHKRNLRNRKMTDRLNTLLNPFGISLDFDVDVVPLSMSHEGGSITERHLLFAVSGKLMEEFGKGSVLIDFLRDTLELEVSDKIAALLEDSSNPFYQYDLLGILKAGLVEKFYVNADEECPDVTEFIRMAQELSAVSAYPYLGDVGDSVTGDKKTQKFEDDFLDELITAVKKMGFNAVTYMPTRNTLGQLKRLMQLCREHSLFEISGEDINSPRQSFLCEALSRPEFGHLVTATWALIGHEKAATGDTRKGMFSPHTMEQTPSLSERVECFATIGKGV